MVIVSISVLVVTVRGQTGMLDFLGTPEQVKNDMEEARKQYAGLVFGGKSNSLDQIHYQIVLELIEKGLKNLPLYPKVGDFKGTFTKYGETYSVLIRATQRQEK